MPSWKKVVTSGSSAHLNHITASGNISGSSTSTGSFSHGYIDDRLQIGTTDTTKHLNVASDIQIVGDSPLLTLNDTGGTEATVQSTSNRLRFSIGGERLSILNSGNVGIGDTNPGVKLEVGGDFKSKGRSMVWNAAEDSTIAMRADSEGSGTFLGFSRSDAAQIYAENFDIFAIGTYQSTPLAFSTNNTSRIYIESAGNVGIGTTSPDSELHVVGDIRATGDVIAENYIVSSSVTYMTQSFSSGSTIFGNSADDTHQFTGSLSTSGSISSKTLDVFSIIQPAAADVYDDVIELGMNSDRKWKFRAGSYHNGDYGSYALLLEQSAASYYGDLGINPGRGLTILKNTTIGRNLDASSDANGGLGFAQKDGDLNIVGNSQDGEINITTYAINGLESGSYLHLRKTDSSKYPDNRATDDGEHIGTIDFIGSKQYAWLNPGFIMKVSQVGAVGSDYSKNKMEIKAGDNATAPSTILTIDNTGISGSSTSTGSFGYLSVSGNSNFTGDLTLGGNIQIGDADTDSITISSDLTSNLIPNADSTYDIGSTSKNWRYGYIEQVVATHVTASGHISASLNITGSDIYSSGRIYEAGSSVIDHATAMAIVFGG